MGARVLAVFTPEGGQIEDVEEMFRGDILHCEIDPADFDVGTPRAAGTPTAAALEQSPVVVKAHLECLVGGEGTEGALVMDVGVPLPKHHRTLLIILCDQSGSMKPSWFQVQSALIYIMGQSFANPDVIVVPVLYNADAGLLFCTEFDYIEKISKKRANGKTCFATLFSLCEATIRDQLKTLGPECDVHVCLMTDGTHTTTRNVKESYTTLKALMHSVPNRTVAHCIGFTSNHRFEDLNRVRTELGKEAGGYQYAEPGDGEFALQQKLMAMFDTIAETGGEVAMKIRLPGFLFQEAVGGGMCPERLERLRVSKEGHVTLRLPIRAEDPAVWAHPVKLALAVRPPQGSEEVVSQHVRVLNIEGETAVVLSELQRLSRAITAIQDGLHTAPPDPNGTATTESQERLAAYSATLHDVRQQLAEYSTQRLFQLPRATRGPILEQREDLVRRLTGLHDVLAAWARGQWNSATKARLADITYGGSFTQARRRRRMNERIERNAPRMAAENAALEALDLTLVPPPERAEAAASVDMFSCVLSLMDWTELYEDKDICGLGLSVARPESVVEDASQLRVQDVGTTFVAKSAMEDALKHGVEVGGHRGTTGGFGGGKNEAVALRGRGREPINAWVPLYIHASHWRIAKLMLRQSLGYFVTLDPLGYSPEQLDALFLVLGVMVSRLRAPVGEREILTVLQLQRTCYQAAVEFRHMERIKQRVAVFVETEKNKLKNPDQVKNLNVLIGYMLVLPPADMDELFGDRAKWVEFWLTLLRVAIRRCTFSLFNHLQERQVDGFIDRVVFGKRAGEPGPSCSASESLSLLGEVPPPPPPTAFPKEDLIMKMKAAKQQQKKKPAADPNVAGPSSEAEEKEETVAEEAVEFKRASDMFLDCEFVVVVPEVNEAMIDSAAPIERVPEPDADLDRVTTAMVDVMGRFSAQMNKTGGGGYPSLANLMSAIRYVVAWRDICEVAKDPEHPENAVLPILDATAGIAPPAWVATIKGAFDGDKADDEASETFGAFFKLVGDLSPCTDAPAIHIVRALIAQGARFRINKQAREAIAAGAYDPDPIRDPMPCLARLHMELRARRDAEIEHSLYNTLQHLRRQRFTGLSGADPAKVAASISLLLGTTRYCDAFPGLLLQMRQAGPGRDVAAAALRVRIIVSGKYTTLDSNGNLAVVPVLDHGTVWLPGHRNNNRLRRVVHDLEAVMRQVFLDEFLIGGTPSESMLWGKGWE